MYQDYHVYNKKSALLYECFTNLHVSCSCPAGGVEGVVVVLIAVVGESQGLSCVVEDDGESVSSRIWPEVSSSSRSIKLSTGGVGVDDTGGGEVVVCADDAIVWISYCVSKLPFSTSEYLESTLSNKEDKGIMASISSVLSFSITSLTFPCACSHTKCKSLIITSAKISLYLTLLSLPSWIDQLIHQDAYFPVTHRAQLLCCGCLGSDQRTFACNLAYLVVPIEA